MNAAEKHRHLMNRRAYLRRELYKNERELLRSAMEVERENGTPIPTVWDFLREYFGFDLT